MSYCKYCGKLLNTMEADTYEDCCEPHFEQFEMDDSNNIDRFIEYQEQFDEDGFIKPLDFNDS